MSKTAFTPGPWHWENGPPPADTSDGYLTILGPDSHGHARATVNDGAWNGGGCAEANAHLIAAAPDLYAACEAAETAIAAVKLKLDATAPEWQEPLIAAFQGCRAALALARGESAGTGAGEVADGE